MKNKDDIKDLFSDKLGSFEAKVNPELWGNIASQIGGGVAASTTGISILSKWLIGLGVSGAAVVSVVVLTSPEEKVLASTPIDTETIAIKKQTENNKAVTTNDDKNYIIQTNSFVDDAISETEEVIIEAEIIQTEEQEEVIATETILTEEEEETIETETILTEAQEEEETIETETILTEAQEEEADEIEMSLVLPNYFSPNNDNNNDEFFITSEGLTSFNIVILNDKNQTVFQSNNPNFIWNGLGLNGNPVPEGNYLYYLTAEDPKGNAINKYSLLRINK